MFVRIVFDGIKLQAQRLKTHTNNKIQITKTNQTLHHLKLQTLKNEKDIKKLQFPGL